MNITEMAPATTGNVQPSPRNPVELPGMKIPRPGDRDTATVTEDKQAKPENRKRAQATQEELQDTLDQLNSAVSAFHRSVRFNLHHDSGQVQVNVVNTDSGKVIREIPSNEMMDMAQRIHDFIGVLLDEKR